MKHISPTSMYIIPMYLRLTTFTKTFPQMSFHLYFFAIFISLWGSTHDSADCWTGVLTDPRLPATASNVCTTDARLGGVGRVPPPPQQKSWLRRCLSKCTHGGTQNTIESFHNLVWERCPKTAFVGRRRLELAIYEATIIYLYTMMVKWHACQYSLN